jgi:hypothetical protein
LWHNSTVPATPPSIEIKFNPQNYPKISMKPHHLPTVIILTDANIAVGKTVLDWTPQPGDYLEHEDSTYAILERRHRYQYKSGGYRLQEIALYVQLANRPTERTMMGGKWVIGDATCIYNAQSELLRCAVLPAGPCADCGFYVAQPNVPDSN